MHVAAKNNVHTGLFENAHDRSHLLNPRVTDRSDERWQVRHYELPARAGSYEIPFQPLAHCGIVPVQVRVPRVEDSPVRVAVLERIGGHAWVPGPGNARE